MDNNQQNNFQQNYGATMPVGNQPQQGYGATMPVGNQPQQGYGATMPAYGQSQQGYGATMPAYGQQYPQSGYSQSQYPQTGYGQMQYQQPYGQQFSAQMSKVAGNVKNIKNDFKGKVSSMGLSMWCLLGIIAAMLLIVSPFMNFATIHISTKYNYESYNYSIDKTVNHNYKIKASDGLSLFELSKASGTVNRFLKDSPEPQYLNKDTVLTYIDTLESLAQRELREEDIDIKTSSINEAAGIAKLLVKGRFVLLISPILIIICGLGLLIFTVINNKLFKIIFSAVPIVFIFWIMACSSHFFSMMGIGAWALLAGVILGLVSAFLDKKQFGY